MTKPTSQKHFHEAKEAVTEDTVKADLCVQPKEFASCAAGGFAYLVPLKH